MLLVRTSVGVKRAMQPSCVLRYLLISLGALGLLTSVAPSQNEPRSSNSEEVQFDSADKVELHGTFYPSKKTKAPCVILLHKLGGSRQGEGWRQLAELLQAEYAVLSFDFRGHGDSTSIGREFWREPNNRLIKGASRNPERISYRDFPTAYVPMLANDVAAAKRYLDRQNDAGACNSANVVVIGAEEGAAIGALWIASEWQRYHMVRNAYMQWVPDVRSRVEGEDIACAVWLSIPRTLGGAYVGAWLRSAGNKVRDKVPMAFFYGDKDTKAASAAGVLMEELKRSGRDKLEYTKLRPKDTKLAGNELIKKSLGTVEEISTYLDKVLQKRGIKAPVTRETENGPPLMLIPLRSFGLALR
jgi:hypothetical protein